MLLCLIILRNFYLRILIPEFCMQFLGSKQNKYIQKEDAMKKVTEFEKKVKGQVGLTRISG